MKLLLKIKQFQTIQLSMNQKFIAIKYFFQAWVIKYELTEAPVWARGNLGKNIIN